ncbi:MAG: SGNH/GDSL hydrolase family protein [Aliihoeflea sp.]|uniref:SGNH/GDSL hydrolase family protein n=1 Tax=Aliihoeflea sp. TaxID=2608088 RepID=UPI0040341BCC
MASRGLRRAAFICLAMILAFGGVPQGAPFAVSPAAAQQQQQQGGGLLRFLFQRNQPAPQVYEAPQRQPQRQRAQPRRQQQGAGGQAQRRQRSSSPGQAAAPAAAAAVAKADDARKVLVVGDFVAGGLAEGLEAAVEADASVEIVARANGSSGLVRDDYYDWPGNLAAMLDELDPAIVVVMLGSNDRQAMSVTGTSEAARSDAWLKEYERRASLMAEAVTAKDIPLVWVGMIPFRPSTMSADMLAFNDIYRKVAEAAGGQFVDVWDGFVDENGAFVASGPDMNGQPTQLRADDGINVTRAGKRKIAFFVEKPLQQALGAAPAPELVFFGPDLPPGFVAGPREAPRIDRTQPVALFAAPATGGELLGRNIVRPVRATPAPRVETEDEPEGAPTGRADNFMRERPAPEPFDAGITGALRR